MISFRHMDLLFLPHHDEYPNRIDCYQAKNNQKALEKFLQGLLVHVYSSRRW